MGTIAGILLFLAMGLALPFLLFKIFFRLIRPKGGPDAEEVCTHCGYDTRANLDRCPECGQPIDRRADDWFPLRDEWPAEPVAPRRPSPQEEKCVVYTSRKQMEAVLVRDQLEIRGVVCNIVIRECRIGAGRGSLLVTEYDAVIWSADVDEAKQLLSRLMIRRKRRPADQIGREDANAAG